MGNEKILKVMAEVNGEVCEREELIHGIALALLTRKNLFVLGDVGQAKSYAIDCFCIRITGAKQFSTLMNKQTDTEQLFGRLDLASLIPGHLPSSVIDTDPTYSDMRNGLEAALEKFRNDPGNTTYSEEVKKAQSALETYEKGLALSRTSRPEYITAGKIPDSNGHCILLDDGEECICPQLISYSLLCKWFRMAVLPADTLLYAELMNTEDKKRCTECGAFFASKSNSVKYCPDCRKRITRRQAAERMRKRRALVTR